MPTREEIQQIVESVLEGFVKDPSEVWKGIYRLLLWYEEGVPHIVEANSLRRGSWRNRAKRVENKLALALGCKLEEVKDEIDLLMRYPPLEGIQRQNPLGIAFVCAAVFLLRKFASSIYTFMPEAVVGETVFQDIRNPPRRTFDIVVLKDDTEYAIVSVKWSIRHDRLRDVLDECSVYKAERPGLKFYFVTNEFMPARLRRVLENDCVNKAFHVSRDIVVEVNGGDGRLAGLEDISSLFNEFVQYHH